MKFGNEARGLLIDVVKQQLLAFFVKKGFHQHRFEKNDLNAELNFRMPIGTLKKELPNGVALVEVVFSERTTVNFIIDVAIAPKHAIVLPHGQVLKPQEIHTSALPVVYRLSSSVLWSRPFCYGFFSKPDKSQADKIAASCVKKSQELIHWFNTGTPGKHMFRLESLVGDLIKRVS